MKLLSRKSLVTAATVVAVSVSGLAAPAMAAETPAKTQAIGSSAPADKAKAVDNKNETGKPEGKDDAKKDEKAKGASEAATEIGGWVKMLTAIASFCGAIMTVGNAVKKLLGM